MENLQPGIGDCVRVRRHAWVIQDVTPYGACRLLTLAGHDSVGHPRTSHVLHPFDDVEPLRTERHTRSVSFAAWRTACAELITRAVSPAQLGAAAHARIDLLPFQLEPALALVTGRGSRVLIADDVGLGKTVQALLCAAELRARGAGRRLLIVCPAGLRDQWAEEARARISLSLTVVDQAALAGLSAAVPADVNPWLLVQAAVVSSDFVKRPEVLPPVAAAGWDAVIVDEAHGASGDSERHQALATLTSRAAFVVLLTATPHSGDEAAFSKLFRLGAQQDDLLVFRRSRHEVRTDAGRRVHTLAVAPSAEERRMHAALATFTRAVRRARAELVAPLWLLLSLLHKRALSSPFALAVSVERRLQCLGRHPGSVDAQLLLPLEDSGGEFDGADAAPMWSMPALDDAAREEHLLRDVLDAARLAVPHDSKLARLRRLLERLREPAIVFTEYRDTLEHVWAKVATHAAVIHGGMRREERGAALGTFHETGLLLATDAAGEGLNLQRECRTVVNLELPWNPMRLEQRIGRVDRIGQSRRVHVIHLVARGTGEQHLERRLSARVSRARARIDTPDPFRGRPAWTEDTSAHVIVLRHRPVLPMQANAAVPVPLVRLAEEGTREAARLAALRQLAARTASVERGTSASLILAARTRRRRLRQLLGQRVLYVVRHRIVDAAGRTIAERIEPLLAPIASPPDAVLRAAEQLGAESRTRWAAEVLSVHDRFAAMRLRRARAVASEGHRTEREHQPGLFDRRADRARRDRSDERRSHDEVAAHRLACAEAAAGTRRLDPAVELILTCGR